MSLGSALALRTSGAAGGGVGGTSDEGGAGGAVWIGAGCVLTSERGAGAVAMVAGVVIGGVTLCERGAPVVTVGCGCAPCRWGVGPSRLLGAGGGA